MKFDPFRYDKGGFSEHPRLGGNTTRSWILQFFGFPIPRYSRQNIVINKMNLMTADVVYF